jgi:hypothetical protein
MNPHRLLAQETGARSARNLSTRVDRFFDPRKAGELCLSSGGRKRREESVQIASEDYPSLAEFPRDQIAGGDGRVKSCATDAGHRASLLDRKAFARRISIFKFHSGLHCSCGESQTQCGRLELREKSRIRNPRSKLLRGIRIQRISRICILLDRPIYELRPIFKCGAMRAENM